MAEDRKIYSEVKDMSFQIYKKKISSNPNHERELKNNN